MLRKGEANRAAWTPEREAVFVGLKHALCNKHVIRAPDLKKEFILRTDASDEGLGAVLMQEHERVFHPICYARKELAPRETRYSAIERECLL